MATFVELEPLLRQPLPSDALVQPAAALRVTTQQQQQCRVGESNDDDTFTPSVTPKMSGRGEGELELGDTIDRVLKNSGTVTPAVTYAATPAQRFSRTGAFSTPAAFMQTPAFGTPAFGLPNATQYPLLRHEIVVNLKTQIESRADEGDAEAAATPSRNAPIVQQRRLRVHSSADALRWIFALRRGGWPCAKGLGVGIKAGKRGQDASAVRIEEERIIATYVEAEMLSRVREAEVQLQKSLAHDHTREVERLTHEHRAEIERYIAECSEAQRARENTETALEFAMNEITELQRSALASADLADAEAVASSEASVLREEARAATAREFAQMLSIDQKATIAALRERHAREMEAQASLFTEKQRGIEAKLADVESTQRTNAGQVSSVISMCEELAEQLRAEKERAAAQHRADVEAADREKVAHADAMEHAKNEHANKLSQQAEAMVEAMSAATDHAAELGVARAAATTSRLEAVLRSEAEAHATAESEIHSMKEAHDRDVTALAQTKDDAAAELRRAQSTLRLEIDALSRANEIAMAELADAETRASDVNGALSHERSETSAAADGLRIKLRAKVEQCNAAKARAANLDAELAANQAAHASALREAEATAAARAATLQEKLEATMGSDLAQRLTSAAAESAAAAAEVEKAHAQTIVELEAARESSLNALAAANAELSALDEEKSTTISGLKSASATLTLEIDALHKANEMAKSELATAKTRASEVDGELTREQTEKSNALDDLEAQLVEKEQLCTAARARVAELNAELTAEQTAHAKALREAEAGAAASAAAGATALQGELEATMAAQMAQQLSAAEADSAAAAAEAATSHSTAVAVLESASASALDALAAAQEKLAAAESAAEEATRNAEEIRESQQTFAKMVGVLRGERDEVSFGTRRSVLLDERPSHTCFFLSLFSSDPLFFFSLSLSLSLSLCVPTPRPNARSFDLRRQSKSCKGRSKQRKAAAA